MNNTDVIIKISEFVGKGKNEVVCVNCGATTEWMHTCESCGSTDLITRLTAEGLLKDISEKVPSEKDIETTEEVQDNGEAV